MIEVDFEEGVHADLTLPKGTTFKDVPPGKHRLVSKSEGV